MTPTRFRECLALIHMSQRGFAELIQEDERRVRRMASGSEEIPADVADWLERAAAWHAENPPPIRQRSRGPP
jgi:plasmid maintenance system antidote protein VapI